MEHIKNLFFLLLTKKFFKKFVAYFLLISFFYIFKSFLWFFFLVFIFSYLFYSLWNHFKSNFDEFIDKYCKVEKRKEIIKKIIWLNFIVILLYLIFVWVLIFIVSNLLPKLIEELSMLPNAVPFVWDYVSEINFKLQEIMSFNSQLGWSVFQVFETQDYEMIIKILSKLKTVWFYFWQFLISLILSLIFIIDRKKIWIYLYKIKESNFSFLYKEYSVILEKIVLSFGLIFKAQALIALVNAVLTVIWLLIIWFMHGGTFPFLLTLWLMVFISWFIPVFWVFISSIPILLIAFSLIWWYSVILEVVLLISAVHIIEAYYLNPRIVSSFLEIPVSLTFVILLLSEFLFWIAWLLIWVSIFYFIIWLLKDFDEMMSEKTKIIKKQKKKITKSKVKTENLILKEKTKLSKKEEKKLKKK